ncbi:unnamed protein product [Knipowitschia caucasica]
MNPIAKRRLPWSLRRMLTDISPKEESTDLELEPSIRDGIILPPRGATAAPPYHDHTTVETKDKSMGRAVCMLCNCRPSLYTCPRCNVPYCSLSCYKSSEHSVCSEDFYKEAVLQELKEMGKTEAEGKKKMQDILLGLRKKSQNADGGMESLLKEGVLSGESEHEDSKINVATIELLSRLAELQEADEENAEEIENILRELQKIGTGNNVDFEDDDAPDEEDEGTDLEESLQRLDIDCLSEEQLWGLLNKKEKKQFVGLIEHGAFNGFVTLWKPWWEDHEENEQVLIEVLQQGLNEVQNDNCSPSLQEVTKQNEINTISKPVKAKRGQVHNQGLSQTGIPSVSEKIPKLSVLCSNPSPLVGFSLVNAIFSYSFTLFFFNGDTDSLMFELCDMILALSETLNSNKIFSSVQEALLSGETSITCGGYLRKDDPTASDRAVEAVAHIFTGRNGADSIGYCMSALSQLQLLLRQARAALPQEEDGVNKKRKYFMARKKCEFLQAWVAENEENINILANELWNEHSKRKNAFSAMNQAKADIERSWKKGRRRGNGQLIEEI